MSQIGQYADTLQAMEQDRRMENVGGAKGDNWFDEAANEEIAQQYAAARTRHLAGRPARIRAAMLQMEIVCPPTTPTTKAPSMEREDSAVSAQTELAILPAKDVALTVFSTPNGLDPYLQIVRDDIDKFLASAPDVKTKKGQAAYRSIAYDLAGSKTKLDTLGKDLVAELKDVPKKIDAERKRVRELLTAWQEEVRKPLTDWEAAETARKDRHVDAIQAMKDVVESTGLLDSAQIQAAIDEMEARVIDSSWEEFLADAAQTKDQCLLALRGHLKARQVHEAEQAELARLRREAEDRAEQDRIRKAQEAAVEQERERVAREQQAEREAAAKREQELLDQAAAKEREAENQRLQLKLQFEQAERQAAQAEASRIAAEQRAEQAAEQARLDEQRRQKEAADEILRQQQARERDQAHKIKIMGEAKAALMSLNITEELAKAIVLKIARREVPHITINF